MIIHINVNLALRRDEVGNHAGYMAKLRLGLDDYVLSAARSLLYRLPVSAEQA